MIRIKKGYFIIEALLSVVLLSMVLLSLFSMVSFLQRRTIRSTFESDASLLLEDGMEVAHSTLLSGWNSYPDGVYSPAFDATEQNWTLVEGEETGLQAIYTRKIQLDKVCRNPNTGEQLAIKGACKGIVDENSRLITTTIEWKDRGETKSIEATLLVYKLPE